MSEFRLIYLLGLGHSGTTLMGRLLNAHSQVVATGGTKNIPLFQAGRKNCACGAEKPEACALWSGVQASLESRGLSLAELQFGYDNQKNLNGDHLRRYFESVMEASNAKAIVDTSRRRGYLEQLSSLVDAEIIPVHIFKDPRAQCSSNRRKGMTVWRSLWNYNLRSLRVRALEDKGYPVIHIPYEALCENPEREIQRIMDAAGLEFESEQVTAFGEKELHVLGGNRQRTDKSSTIRLDESWRHRLKPWEQKAAVLLGGEAHRKNLESAGRKTTSPET